MSFRKHMLLVCVTFTIGSGLGVMTHWQRGELDTKQALVRLIVFVAVSPIVAILFWPLRRRVERLARALLRRIGIPVRPERNVPAEDCE